MNRSERIESQLSDVLTALREIWAALKGVLLPNRPRPEPIPVRVPSER
jgi:hypothetical protein